jgi:hypothetical protein
MKWSDEFELNEKRKKQRGDRNEIQRGTEELDYIIMLIRVFDSHQIEFKPNWGFLVAVPLVRV